MPLTWIKETMSPLGISPPLLVNIDLKYVSCPLKFYCSTTLILQCFQAQTGYCREFTLGQELITSFLSRLKSEVAFCISPFFNEYQFLGHEQSWANLQPCPSGMYPIGADNCRFWVFGGSKGTHYFRQWCQFRTVIIPGSLNDINSKRL